MGGPQLGDMQPAAGPWNDAASWSWQVLPGSLIYHSYLAGTKEPRFATQWFHDSHWGWTWDATLGARIGLLRDGSDDCQHPDGWQLDLEGAAFPRLDLEHQENVTSVDFRFGVLDLRLGPLPGEVRLLPRLLAPGRRVHADVPGRSSASTTSATASTGVIRITSPSDLRVYAEADWAFECDGGAKPWEFQFGVEYSPAGPTGWRPVPFFAINGDIRQEVDFGGNVCVEAGWQWRSAANRLLRAGLQYFTGKSDQYEFFKQYEEKIGLGFWYDF